MAAPREEEQKLEEIVKQSRIEGDTLKLEVMRKAPEQVVHERMCKGERVKCTKEKKKVKGRSTEEMKDKANSLF